MSCCHSTFKNSVWPFTQNVCQLHFAARIDVINNVMMMFQNQQLQSSIQQLNETVGSWQACYYEVHVTVLFVFLLAYDAFPLFCHTGPISLCVHSFVYICVYFVCFCFILHSCCITFSMVGWT